MVETGELTRSWSGFGNSHQEKTQFVPDTFFRVEEFIEMMTFVFKYARNLNSVTMRQKGCLSSANKNKVKT